MEGRRFAGLTVAAQPDRAGMGDPRVRKCFRVCALGRSACTGPQSIAAKLGGAYFVHDAEIDKLGSCETERRGLIKL